MNINFLNKKKSDKNKNEENKKYKKSRFSLFEKFNKKNKQGELKEEIRVIENLDALDNEGVNLKEQQKQEEKERKRAEKEKKRAEKEKQKAIRKAVKEELKKDKEELYQMRKNTFYRILRAVFWALILLIFIRGVIAAIRPDPTVEVNKTIEEFKVELLKYREQNNEILAFAENFMFDYMSYEVGKEEEYKERIKKYADKKIYNAEFDFENSAKVIFANAYKKEQYADNQFDVYTLVEIEYSKKVISEDNTQVDDQVIKNIITVKVPVAVKDNRYIVEDTPLFINDNVKIKDYNEEEVISGQELPAIDKEKLNKVLFDFFTAYYEGNQNVIDYFLTPETDNNDFIGLEGKRKFVEITASRYYQLENNKKILGIISFVVKDVNDVEITQNLNIVLEYKNEQYYIRDLNARTTNLKQQEDLNND